MKVVLSVEPLAHTLTGIGRYTWELANRLPRASGMQEVRYFRAGRWVADPAELLSKALPPAVEAAASASTATKRRRLRFKWPKAVKDFATRQALRGRHFHGPNYYLPPGVEAGVVTVHDLSVIRLPHTHPEQRVRDFERDFVATLARAAHIVTDTHTVRDEVIAHFGWAPEKITAVHLGVDARFRPQEDRPLPMLLTRRGLLHGGYTLCVSTLEPRKRIGALIDAYRLLPADLRLHRPLVLVGGSGWLSDELHGMVADAQSQGWLHYLGYVPEDDLPAIYGGAALFAYPSLYEGFGLPLAEAMASGVPVVAASVSCLPEVCGAAAALVDVEDVAGFSEALRRGLEDELWRSTACADGLAVAGRYTWDACVTATADVYRRVWANA